jgi:acyl carrier protein
MTKNEFVREIEKIVEADPDSLAGNEPLSAVQGWDSMATMGFIAMVDSQIGVVVVPQKLADCRTITDLIDLVASHLTD